MAERLTEKKFSSPKPTLVEVEFDLGHSRIFKRSDGIVELHCADNFVYDMKHIQQNHNRLQGIAEGKKIVVLNIAGVNTTITKDARDYVSFGFHKQFIAAECFLIRSLSQRLLANFFIRVSKPKVPAQYFDLSKKAEAEKWLRKYKE